METPFFSGDSSQRKTVAKKTGTMYNTHKKT